MAERRPRLLAALLAALMVTLGAGCGGDDEAGGDDPDAPATSPPREPLEPDGELPALPDNDDIEAVQCTGPPRGTFDATSIVGESLRDAAAAAEAEGCSVREVVRDGEGLATTQDFRPDRVNVETEAGTVVRIVDLG